MKKLKIKKINIEAGQVMVILVSAILTKLEGNGLFIIVAALACAVSFGLIPFVTTKEESEDTPNTLPESDVKPNPPEPLPVSRPKDEVKPSDIEITPSTIEHVAVEESRLKDDVMSSNIEVTPSTIECNVIVESRSEDNIKPTDIEAKPSIIESSVLEESRPSDDVNSLNSVTVGRPTVLENAPTASFSNDDIKPPKYPWFLRFAYYCAYSTVLYSTVGWLLLLSLFTVGVITGGGSSVNEIGLGITGLVVLAIPALLILYVIKFYKPSNDIKPTSPFGLRVLNFIHFCWRVTYYAVIVCGVLIVVFAIIGPPEDTPDAIPASNTTEIQEAN